MNIRTLSAIVLVTSLVATLPTSAQQLEQIAQRYREDQKQLADYTWKTRVKYSIDDRVGSTELYQVRYGSDGKLQKTLISTEVGKAKKDQDQAAQTLQTVRDLIDAYTNMSPDQFRKAFESGSSPLPFSREEGGLTQVTAQGIIHIDDSMQVWVDSATNRLRKFEIRSVLQKQPLQLVAEFRDLENGPTYVAESTFETNHKKKKIVIVTENSEFERLGGD